MTGSLFWPVAKVQVEKLLFRIAAKIAAPSNPLRSVSTRACRVQHGREGRQVPGAERVQLPGNNRLTEPLLELMVT